MNISKLKLWATAIPFMLVLALGAQNQSTVTLSGTVTDSSGAVVSGTKVTIKADCKCSECENPKECKCCPDQIFARTDSSGRYEAKLTPGKYHVAAMDAKVDVEVQSGADQTVNLVVRKK